MNHLLAYALAAAIAVALVLVAGAVLRWIERKVPADSRSRSDA